MIAKGQESLERVFDKGAFVKGIEAQGFTDVTQMEHKGEMKDVFVAKQNGKDARPVVIKIDKDPTSDVTAGLRRRGCGLDNEFDIGTEISIEEAIANGLVPVIAGGVSAGIPYTVEPLFSDSVSLRDALAEGNPLLPSESRDLMIQTANTVAFLRRKGFYHRDLNGGNILIKKTKSRLETKITDLGNAARADSVQMKSDPTAGGRFVRDPLLSSPFIGQAAQFNDGSEIYALAMQDLTAAIGQPPVSYDPEKGVAINCFTGESILDGNGRLDNEKHKAAIKTALGKLPRKLRRFREVLEKGLSIDSSYRYESIENFRRGFEMANAPSFLERIVGNKTLNWMTGFVATIAALGGGTAYFFPEVGPWQGYVDAIREANKLPVTTEWDFRGPVLTNDLIKPKVYAYVDRDVQKENGRIGSLFYPTEVNHLQVEPGDKVHVHISCEELPHKKIDNGPLGSWLPSFRGRAYIQGIPLETEQRPVYHREGNNSLETIVKNDFRVQAIPPNFVMEGPGSIDYGDVSITVPLGTPDGNYILPVEIYQPTREMIENDKRGTFDNISYPNPGGLLSWSYIPVVVGHPSREMTFSFLGGGGMYSNKSIYFKLFSDNSPWTMGSSEATIGLIFELRIPEEGRTQESDLSGNQSLTLDGDWFRGKNLSTDLRTLEISARDSEGREVLYEAFPIRRKFSYESNGQDFYSFDFAYPDQGFSERVLKLREERLRERDQTSETSK